MPNRTVSAVSTDAPSALEAARQLADVLYDPIKPDSSPEGHLWRGEAEPGVAADQVEAGQVEEQEVQRTSRAASKARHTRHPELRGMKLDPFGLADNAEPSAGDDYQR